MCFPLRGKVLFLFLLSALLLLPSLSLTAGRPTTFDALIGFGRVREPQVSPDSEWVAYVVDSYDKASNARSSRIWLASIESGENRPLTRTDKRDRNPRWSPDGEVLAFLSNRSGSWQVWTIRPDGGEATQLTELPVEVASFEWSPDGKWLALTAEVYPDCNDPGRPGGGP